LPSTIMSSAEHGSTKIGDRMPFNRGGRTAGFVFAILGVALGIGPALKLYRRVTGEVTEHPVLFDRTDGALLGLGIALILLCLYFLLRRGKEG
jgi:hypothetical protein